jgi:hypothetical protein
VQLPVKRDPPVNVATAVLTEILLGRTEELDTDVKVDDVALTSKHRDISQSQRRNSATSPSPEQAVSVVVVETGE